MDGASFFSSPRHHNPVRLLALLDLRLEYLRDDLLALFGVRQEYPSFDPHCSDSFGFTSNLLSSELRHPNSPTTNHFLSRFSSTPMFASVRRTYLTLRGIVPLSP